MYATCLTTTFHDPITDILPRAEFGRAAQAAFRTTSLLRNSAVRCQPSQGFTLATSMSCRRHISTTSSLQAFNNSKSAPSPFWSNPTRETRPTQNDDTNIRKPNIAAYDDPLAGLDTRVGNQNDLDESTSMSDGIDLELLDLQQTKYSKPATPQERPAMRLVPRTGRTINVGRNVDVARSFKLLAVQVAQNKLRQDFQYQRYHERPGLKRKRLKSERWQKRFKRGFKATVSRVKELTKQGW
ncbi:Uu.00g021020.m01.CDS01 [Anthostomella pinea]|uniref:Uu.00g021020.m01.CDS01 n=1 Tax=Anthostomella pinea TaxID=933095 RepID=A0AAI8YQT5_9PEZI|nr:Uu.00g021020.m01.CDS01 [Anthostomella pinea]